MGIKLNSKYLDEDLIGLDGVKREVNKFKKWLKSNYTKILRDSSFGIIAASDLIATPDLITASDRKKKNKVKKK